MDGDVGAPLLEGDFEFLDEEALAADGGQAAVLDSVAFGGHGNEFDAQAGVSASQQACHMFSLPEGERTLARGDAQHGHGGAHGDSDGTGNSADVKR